MKIFSKIIALIFIMAAAQSALAARPNINFCGSTQRSGAALYSGLGTLNESFTCTPDSDTRALLVTRYGSISGNGAAWLAYLNAGGVIITEYSISAAVYNEIYGTALATPNSLGSCEDNAMPAIKLNPADPFWTSNPGLVETAPGNQACGFDLTPVVNADASITPLGGFSPSGIQLARKVQGSGVLFLLDADWQDNESSWTASSGALMSVLINGGSPTAPRAPVAVPTLGEWAMIFLAGLMALFAFRRTRRQ